MSRSAADRARLDAAVKRGDSPFTTFVVSPWSKHVARFGAERGWTPNAVTVASLVLGIGSAAAFATGSRAGLVGGAVLLQLSFAVDCIDGQLARYARAFTRFGGWLDSVLDRAKEALVYAGLAIGSARGFDDDVWLLAAVALALLTVRHVSDFAWVASRAASADAARPPAGIPRSAPAWLRAGNQLLRLPIGERLALVSVTAALFSPRWTFVALLVWGGVGLAYALAVRLLVSSSARARALRFASK